MKSYGKYIRKHWKLFLTGVFFLALEATADLFQPLLMARIVDQGVANNDLDMVFQIGLTMLGVTLLGAGAACTRNILASRVSQDFGTELRSDVFEKVQKLSFSSIDRLNRASLITRITNDVTQVQNFVNGMMRIFVKAPLMSIGSIIMAMNLNLRLSWVLAFVVPVVAMIIFLNMRLSYPIFTRMQQALDRLNGGMREYLSGVRVVKAFNRFDFEVSKFQDQNRELAGISIKAMRLSAFMNPAVTFTINMGLLAILWIGGNFVEQGYMEVGGIIAFTTYMTQIMVSLMMTSMVFNMFIRAKASAQRISEVLEEVEDKNASISAQKGENLSGSIAFRDVSFAYGDGPDILKGLSFTIEKGQRVGILGATGSGKSTLIHLINKFYDPTSGTIEIGGVDMKRLPAGEVREHIAMVPQKSTLFTGTILENLKWGKPDATLDEVVEVAKIAQIHDYIASLPEGYHSRVGQGGVNFSGGQRQRLAIARALIRKPEILILDDSTSAVDAKTEASLKEALRNFATGTTCLMIAQKISSVADSDQIIVLDEGEVVAIGHHEELLRSSPIYLEIVESQLGKEALANE